MKNAADAPPYNPDLAQTCDVSETPYWGLRLVAIVTLVVYGLGMPVLGVLLVRSSERLQRGGGALVGHIPRRRLDETKRVWRRRADQSLGCSKEAA